MHFVLNGFRQEMEFRMFAFEGIAADRTRTAYTVKADTALSRKYGIQVQELPLLCVELLERVDAGEENHALTFTEEDMRRHADRRAEARAAALLKRKPAPKPAKPNPGMAWRTPQGSV